MFSLKSLKNKLSTLALASSITFAGLVGLSPEAKALNPDITIPLGQVAPFQVPEGITTLVIGDPNIAEVVIPPGQNKLALINTKSAGTTNILVWTEKGAAPNNFILEVQNTKRDEQVVSKVKVLEVFNGSDGKLGIDWQDFITFAEAPMSAPFKFGLPVRTASIEAKVDTLINERKAKLLAQPTLVSLNGSTAKFLSGGEYPVVIYEQNRVNIQWKEYGIRLEITAKVEGTDNIVVTVKPEVSSVDRANSVILTGSTSTGSAVIPAFSTRRAETTLIMKDNDSLVIAGLLNNSQEYIDSKVPVLGDIPVLGFLFKSREFKDVKTELVFIVNTSILKGKQIKPEKDYAIEAAQMEKK